MNNSGSDHRFLNDALTLEEAERAERAEWLQWRRGGLLRFPPNQTNGGRWWWRLDHRRNQHPCDDIACTGWRGWRDSEP